MLAICSDSYQCNIMDEQSRLGSTARREAVRWAPQALSGRHGLAGNLSYLRGLHTRRFGPHTHLPPAHCDRDDDATYATVFVPHMVETPLVKGSHPGEVGKPPQVPWLLPACGSQFCTVAGWKEPLSLSPSRFSTAVSTLCLGGWIRTLGTDPQPYRRRAAQRNAPPQPLLEKDSHLAATGSRRPAPRPLKKLTRHAGPS